MVFYQCQRITKIAPASIDPAKAGSIKVAWVKKFIAIAGIGAGKTELTGFRTEIWPAALSA